MFLFFMISPILAFTDFFRNMETHSATKEFQKELFLSSFANPSGKPKTFLDGIKERMFRRQLAG